jgi:ketosteroid isomerase-like protein
MRSTGLQLSFILLLSPLAITSADTGGNARLVHQVEDTERAFARTMADRDFEAFKTFLDAEAVFFSGETPLRGSAAVAEHWQAYFEPAEAPFSWLPDTVQVLDSGSLAFSSGPVFDPLGRRMATFHSVWRRNGDGEWRIVFDKGSRFCE